MFLLLNIIKYFLELFTYKPHQMWHMSHSYDAAKYQGKPTYTDGFGHTYHVKTGKMVFDTSKDVDGETHKVLIDSSGNVVQDLTKDYEQKIKNEDNILMAKNLESTLKNRYIARKNAILSNNDVYVFEEKLFIRTIFDEINKHTIKGKVKAKNVICNINSLYYSNNGGYVNHDIFVINSLYDRFEFYRIEDVPKDVHIYLFTITALEVYKTSNLIEKYNINYEEYRELLSYYGLNTLYITNDEYISKYKRSNISRSTSEHNILKLKELIQDNT